MNHESIRVRLTGLFRDVFDDDTIVVTDEMTAKDVEAWDSLTHVNLIVACEKAFEMTFTTREVQVLANVGDFIRLIERKSQGVR